MAEPPTSPRRRTAWILFIIAVLIQGIVLGWLYGDLGRNRLRPGIACFVVPLSLALLHAVATTTSLMFHRGPWSRRKTLLIGAAGAVTTALVGLAALIEGLT